MSLDYDPQLCARGSGQPWRTCPCGDCAFTRHLHKRCEFAGCERTADHNQGGSSVCSGHLDNSPTAPRAFARND